MAGIYIHIPFCKKACHYCDFHFSTQLNSVSNFVNSLCNEIVFKKSILQTETIQTIYFGGGTPTILEISHLEKILKTIFESYSIDENPEITIEANPDDLNIEFLKELYLLKFNRLSIGIQTFNDDLLIKLNRNHLSIQSENAIVDAQKAGFANISCDLIYAYPSFNDTKIFTSFDILKTDINKLISFDIEHISAYNMTIEQNTVFGKWNNIEKISALNDELALQHFDYVINTLESHKFEQYEISNFARNKHYSKHNSSYWFGKHYLGFGPSAHSFYENKRFANISNNQNYVQFWEKAELHDLNSVQSVEFLSTKDIINEHILTRLRTKWGISLEFIASKMNSKQFEVFEKSINQQVKNGNLYLENQFAFLTHQGKYLADNVALDLFL